MAIDLKFSKFDSSPWGFRLTGGSDFNCPLTVVKVNEGSLSESMGLREGDVLVALNDQKVGWITHDHANDCITRAGNNFFITILRGNYDPEVLQKYAIPEERIDSVTPPYTQDIYPSPLTNGTVNKVSRISPYSCNAFIVKPKATQYRPFSQHVPDCPPYERPLILSPQPDQFQTIGKERSSNQQASKIIKPIPKLATCNGPLTGFTQDDVLVNGEILLDVNDSETSAKRAAEAKRERNIQVKKESNGDLLRETFNEQCNGVEEVIQKEMAKETAEKRLSKENVNKMNQMNQLNQQNVRTTETITEKITKEEFSQEDVEVKKSFKKIVQDFETASTPSPNVYKMSCRIRNPSVTPVAVIENVDVDRFELVEVDEPVTVKRCETPVQKPIPVRKPSPPIIVSKEVRELSTSNVSLEEAKSIAINAASILSQEAKQRNYKIPSVAANIPVQSQTDVFLKTFFIHLTDVMVALTQMITKNECCHCTHIHSQQVQQVQKEVVCGETCQQLASLLKMFSETVNKSQTSTESSSKTTVSSESVSKKSTESKATQMTPSEEKPPDQLVSKVCETRETGRVLKEVFQKELGVDVTVNGKDPLEWLADLDNQQKTEQVTMVKKFEKKEEKEEAKQETMTREEMKIVKQEATSLQESTMSQSYNAVLSESNVEENIRKEVSASNEVAIKEDKSMDVTIVKQEALNAEEQKTLKVEEQKTLKVEEQKTLKVEEQKTLKVEAQEKMAEIAAVEESKVVEGSFSSESYDVVCKLRKEEVVEESESYKLEESSQEMSETAYEEAYEEDTVTEAVPGEKKKRKKMMKVIAKNSPETPNVDEYLFKIDIKLPGKQQTEEQNIHEDFSIVRKPGGIVVKTITDESAPKYIKPDQAKTDIISDPLTSTGGDILKKKSLKLDLHKEDVDFIPESKPSVPQRALAAAAEAAKQSDLFVLVCQPSPIDPNPPDLSVTLKSKRLTNKESSAASKMESSSLEMEKSQSLQSTISAETNILSDNKSSQAYLSESKKLADAKSVSFAVDVDDSEATQVFKLPTKKATESSCEATKPPSISASAASQADKGREPSDIGYTLKENDRLLQTKETQQESVATKGLLKLAQTNGSSIDSYSETNQQCLQSKSTNFSMSHSSETKEEFNRRMSEVVTTDRSIKSTEGRRYSELGQINEEAISESQKIFEALKTSKTNEIQQTNGTVQDGPATNGFSNGFEPSVNGVSEAKLNEGVEELKKVLEDGGKAEVTDQAPVTFMIKESPKAFASVQPSRINGNGLGPGATKGFYNVDDVLTGLVTDEEAGKAGMTDEEIAEIISGESEVLKDQHVIGLQKVLASHMNRPDDDDSSVNFNKMMPVIGFLKDSEVFKALNDETIKGRAELMEEQRKHTKFLQKPNRPIPFCKRLAIETTFKDPPYKVCITKQPKKEPGSSILTEGVFLIPEVPILVPEPAPEILVAPEYLADSEFPDLEDTGIPLPVTPLKPEVTEREITEEQKGEAEEETKEERTEEEDKKASEEVKPEEQWTDLVVDETIDEDLPVEQQLVKVQKQLEALSRLPAAIQQTLDLVSKQLGKMVPRTGDTPKPEEKQNGETTEEQTNGECAEETEAAEATEEESAECKEDSKENGEVDPSERETTEDHAAERTGSAEDTKVEGKARTNGVEGPLNEQETISKMKQDLMDELSSEHTARKEKQSRTVVLSSCGRRTPGPKPVFGPLTPAARPLVLPGGRKWKGPKDAFTDSFIAETLSAQASVITGTTLGPFESVHLPYDDRVNFLKYKKPPVVLDHIKESSTYKLVHEMDDSPQLAIETRPARVLSESEYRERCRSTTPSNMQ